MLEDFEKKTCKAAEQVLKSKLFEAIETKYPSSKFNELGEAVLTSLLVCSYMKTFDNPETEELEKAIKQFCDFKTVKCDCEKCTKRTVFVTGYGYRSEQGFFGGTFCVFGGFLLL